MPKERNSFIDRLVGLVLGGGTVVVVLLAIVGLGRFVNSLGENTPPDVVETPPIEIPPDITSSGSQVPLVSVPLLSQAYTVPQNPFDAEEYASLFPRIVLNGSFEQVILNVKGKVGSADAFLIFNFNNQGGIVRAVRESPTRLNIPQTLARGGIFPAGSTIDISINLLKETMGTIATEFSKTNIGEREFEFISGEEPIDVIPIAIIPFTNKGGYGGTTIGELTISYSCKNGSDCKISKCENHKKYTQCIKDVYGEDAMDEWMKRNL